jgi:hypothetical protein
MSLRRYLSIILTLLMFNPIGPASLLAMTRGGWKKYSPGQLRTALGALGTGQDARVTGKLRDKTPFSGFVTQVDPTRFLVMDAQARRMIPVSYVDVKELRAENAGNGVQFAARVSHSLTLEINSNASLLAPGAPCCQAKHEWIGVAVAGGLLLFLVLALATAKN